MPLFNHTTFQGAGHLFLWEITEGYQALVSQVVPSRELSEIHHPQKKIEFLASRLLVATALTELGLPYAGLQKDEFQRPHLVVPDTGQLSISHTAQYAAVAWHPERAVGLDIEPISEKLRTVAHRFLSEAELVFALGDLIRLAVCWSAKEAVYKWHGRRQLSFRGHLFVEPFPATATKITVRIHQKEKCNLEVYYFENHVAVVMAK